MKTRIIKLSALVITTLIMVACASSRHTSNDKTLVRSTPTKINVSLEFEFYAGEKHNNPSFAFWVEDLAGNYIETLFVTQYFARGQFGHGEVEPGKWKNEPGEARRPATLPYWSHKRNIKAEDGLYAPSPATAVPDAISGATPKGDFILETGSKVADYQKFRVLMEVNQAWDANDYWSNNKYPDDPDYNTSLQPSLVYAVTIDPEKKVTEYFLNPIGHGHPSGKTGELFTDLTTLTTAKQIVEKVSVRLK